MQRQPFLHNHAEQLGQVLDSCNAVLRDLAEAPGAESRVPAILTMAADTYRSLGLGVGENEILCLHAELSGAQRGIYPSLASTRTTYRRTAARAVALRVLLRCADRLREDVSEQLQQLNQARGELVSILFHAIENGILTAADLPGDPEARATEAWRQLRAHPATQNSARHVLTKISTHDAVLLLVDIFESTS